MNLPDKPSELLALALHDLELCENDHHYKIEMRYWYKQDLAGVCNVCLAGAVLAQTLQIKNQLPQNWQESQVFNIITQDTNDKIHALNSLRIGDLQSAGLILNNEKLSQLPNVPVINYSQDSRLFKKDMRRLINLLEEKGL